MSKKQDPIPGIKVIEHAPSGINVPDDPSFPWKLVVTLSPPEFMEIMFIFMYGGSETIIVRGMTREALEKFVEANDLRTHPRLRSLNITGPEQP